VPGFIVTRTPLARFNGPIDNALFAIVIGVLIVLANNNIVELAANIDVFVAEMARPCWSKVTTAICAPVLFEYP
jgi:hypothetical protein